MSKYLVIGAVVLLLASQWRVIYAIVVVYGLFLLPLIAIAGATSFVISYTEAPWVEQAATGVGVCLGLLWCVGFFFFDHWLANRMERKDREAWKRQSHY